MIDKTDPTNRDTVPAMLTPGEFVLNKEASTMFAPVIEQMNNAGLQHRAMKNMGGGIQNYNDGSAGGVKASPYTYEDKIAFIKEITPHANRVGAKLGIDPKLIIAQAIQETGWGEKVKGNNFFGIKSHGKEGGQTITTHENIDGKKVKVKDSFRKYDNMGQSVEDYGNFLLNNPRYKGVLEADGLDAQIEAMGNSGYATDPNYGNALSNIVAGRTFVNNYTSTPIAEVPQPTTQTASSEPVPKIFSGGGADGVGNFGTIGDFFGGITTPPVETVSSIPPKTMPNTQANPIAVEQAIMQASVPQVQAAPPVPTSFGQAFKDARADMGAGGIFTFRGNDYSTNYAEEEDKKMTANMGGSVYLNMGGYPQEYLDNYRKAIMANMGPEYLARTERMGGRDVTPEGIDAARELQAQVRPDYTPGNVAEDSASSEPMAYNDPALKVRSDGMIDLSLPDRRLDKNLYLSQPNTGMTTEESIAKRKNLASNSYVPMPEVNSDESLLQGSSGSVASAARSFPSDYPINMDVPRVEGYNIPVPIPAPRPTMLGGQLYYLNGDGLVTDSNGNPVQDPEIGAAVQDKLNYSAEESAANAQAYNESIAQQNVLNGTNPQSVNPSYDSMRQQQESNAAEAERIRAEIAQIDRERQALNDEFNNREPAVVPPLGTGPLVVEGFVPNSQDTRNLGGSEGYGQTGDATSRRAEAQRKLIAMREGLIPGSPEHIRVSSLITGAFTPSMTSLDELINYGALGAPDVPAYEGELGLGIPSLVANPPTTPPVDYSGLSEDAVITLMNDGDEAAAEEVRRRINQANLNDVEVDIRRNRGYSVENETPIDPSRPQITEDLSPSVYRESQKLNVPLPEGVDLNNIGAETAVSSHEQALDILATPNLPDSEYVKANESLLAPDKGIPVDQSALDERGEGTGRQKFSSLPKVKAKVAEISGNAQPTTPDQDIAAKAAANQEEARLKELGKGADKNTPEVSGAMSMLKSVFGDLFDSKELIRAAIMYLGGRATGMDGNQALAFAGKNYIARTDAKVGTYQKIALEGKHTKDSLAVYKKTMNPADLVAKGQPAIETGDYKDVYHTKSGTPVKLIEKETSTGRKLYYYKGEQVLLDDFTTDGRYSVGSKDHEIYVGQLESAVISQVKELQEINMTDSDSNGKGSKPIIGITPTGVATQAAKYVIKNQLPREVMRDLVSIAYKDAVAEKKSTGKTPSSLEPFFEKAYVKSRTSNVVNFTLGNGKPAPAASVNQFFRTIRDMATAAEQVENPDFKLSSLNDTQLSTWLLQSKTYTSWNQITDPEEKKFFVDRGAKEVPPRSGFMQYVLEGYPKTS